MSCLHWAALVRAPTFGDCDALLVLVDADPPLSLMHRIGGVGMNEGAGSNELGTLGIGKLVGSDRRREDVGKDKQSKCDTDISAEHAAENEDGNAASKSVHGTPLWFVNRPFSGEGREPRPLRAIVRFRSRMLAIRSGRKLDQESRYPPSHRRSNKRDRCRWPNHGPRLQPGSIAPALRATKKERSGLQSACDELIDKGAIITGE
jgi:hypothetical protein